VMHSNRNWNFYGVEFILDRQMKCLLLQGLI
jgi:hypothetical protein